MFFNETYNRVNHLIPSVKNQNKWFGMLGTSNCANYSTREPKTQCKVCLSYWDVGIVHCACGHFLRKGTEENKKFVQCTMVLLSIPNYNIKKGRPHGHRYGKKPGGQRILHRPFTQEEMQKEVLLGYRRPIHTRRSSARTWLTTVEPKKFVAKWMTLRDEDHTHHLTPEEIDDYRSNWWIRSNKIVSDTMPIRHRSDLKQALSTLRQLKDKEDEAQRNQRWTQS